MLPPTLPFRREHRLIERAACQLRTVVSRHKQPDPSILFAMRQRLGLQLVPHLNGEDWMLYPRLRASGDADLIAIADRFVAELGTLSRSFTSYRAQWTSVAAAADWPGFCAATHGILDMLETRCHREETELFPLIDALAERTVRKAA